MNEILPGGPDRSQYDEFLTEGIWYELYGDKPPVFISNLRDALLQRAELGEELNKLEVTWLNVIALGPDLF
ncbi:hypothetical protein A2803_00770 [Candidatus Woesebacteria bacterium RIFCSPHIGHO2_01_FULL_44_21]|uniref:Uncharacterized protein n=1 Tax=Candidatus Woesebacteria bacterium RIFCSPHIGHO2_01_FULL_44_21 TaxID=1802503 RepID=A0A1F7YY35_9BACT|nr:MAG: hypothetical protein A2803_00770 [Candidatus Woesebacteria bacterium RIFCSPHIGHO2_01_FULL_44_21]OGM70394.1 MAG: hypothetical protein A2897_01200 [Candidatus Woesebacteria bacterium RIFCSPLOWO2_01_FULL_44_24b]